MSKSPQLCITRAPPAVRLKWNCNATLKCHSCAPELGDTQNPASFGNIFFLFALNQSHSVKILMPFIYTHVGEKSPRSCEKLNHAGSFVRNSRISWFYFSICLFLYSAHERCLENFTPTGRRVRVTFPGWKANTGVIGFCVWILFLLISCAIKLADEKNGEMPSLMAEIPSDGRTCLSGHQLLMNHWGRCHVCHGGYW